MNPACRGASGEPAQRFTYSGFTVNGRESEPRLLVEYLDAGYAEDRGSGVLYKSLASGQFTYQGGDQTEYGDDFKQINNIGGTDLQPVIDLIEWVETASDEEFAAGLADRVDVESFARYIALQNIVMNFDDMAGPGRNYYLWYDLETRRFTVVSWDMNLAFSGDATAGPHDASRMGPGGGGQLPQGDAKAGSQPPGGMQLPEGVELPEGMQPPGEGGPGGNGGFGGNKLKERFLETGTFKQLYEQQYREMYAAVLAGGQGDDALTSIVEAYQRNKGASAAVESEADTLRGTLTQRVTALNADEIIHAG